MPGRTQALVDTVEQIAAGQARRGDITDSMAELLTAARDYRVVNVGGRWVIDVSWLARVALDAGLVAQVGEVDRTLLRLTRSGRAAVARVWGLRALAEAVRAARTYSSGHEAGVADERAAAAEQARRRRLRRAVCEVAWVCLWLTVGAGLAYLTVGR